MVSDNTKTHENYELGKLAYNHFTAIAGGAFYFEQLSGIQQRAWIAAANAVANVVANVVAPEKCDCHDCKNED